ncbi:MAG: AMP-binding protein [Burkholderiaceae bacterium]|nr:AMP-binding protein [Burkholderiaceae bacterium]
MHRNELEVANVGALLARVSRLHGERVALQSADARLSYTQLDQRSNRLANALLGLGLQRGERVGVCLPNSFEVVELELACYKAALVKAPINARLSPHEVAQVVANAGATLVLTTRARADAWLPLLQGPAPRLLLLDAAPGSAEHYETQLARADDAFEPARVQRDELAVLHYTSGSSGTLKAAMQTFGNRLAQLRKFLMRGESMKPGDILGLVGPITHASGMQLVPALCSGATIRLFKGFEPEPFLRQMRDDRVTHTFLVPTMIHMLLEEQQRHPLALPDLKRLGYGAAPMAPARILRAMDVFGPILSQGYGAGETTSGVIGLTAEDHVHARAFRPERLASCGRPYLESEIHIVDDAGRPLGIGEVGEIVVGGPDVFAGYWQAPELTAEVLKNGRYHTGDLARRDEDGYISIVDRKKDMVISGGFNVYPTEVEAVLYQHPAVAEACVFAVPDEKWGEVVAAHVVLRPGATLADTEFEAFCAERLGGFKKPRRVEVVAALPKNANGKVARKQVQDPYWAGRSRRVN